MSLLQSNIDKGNHVCLTNPSSPNFGRVGVVLERTFIGGTEGQGKIKVQWGQRTSCKIYNYRPDFLRKATFQDFIKEANRANLQKSH